jgi:hypothetical protein
VFPIGNAQKKEKIGISLRISSTTLFIQPELNAPHLLTLSLINYDVGIGVQALTLYKYMVSAER